MTIKNFVKMMDIEYVEDREFFVCKNEWANVSFDNLVEDNLTMDELLEKYGDREIVKWTIENEMSDGELVEIGFIIK